MVSLKVRRWVIDSSVRAWSLFVDDGRLSLSTIDWVASIPFLHYIKIDPAYNGILLFLGLAGLLIESVIRRTRRPKKPSSGANSEGSLTGDGENN
jgi:hypothetical protein